jgi:hypothetical protein
MVLAYGRPNSVTRDHVLPRSRGGRGARNIVAACYRCNNVKGDMTAEEFVAAYRGRDLPETLCSLAAPAEALARGRAKASRRAAMRRAMERELAGHSGASRGSPAALTLDRAPVLFSRR